MVRENCGRVFVVVQGGKVTNVEVPTLSMNGTHTVIDFDEAEDPEHTGDARRMWESFDEVDRAYLADNYPDLMEAYWGEWMGMEAKEE